jgi:MFS family permease
VLYGLAERLAFPPGGALVPLLVSRVLAGIMAANIGTAQAYVADVTPPDRRAGGMGLMGAAIGLGFVLGPALGALFTAEALRSRFGLGIAGFAAAAICGSNLVWAWLALPESLPARHRATVRREGLLTRRTLLLAYPPLLLLLGVLFLNSLSFSQFEATFSLLSRHRLGLSPTQIGLIFSYLGGIVVVTQGWLARRWVARLGERVTLALGVVLMGAGLGSLPWFGDAWLLGLPLALLGIGYGALQPSQLALISKHSPATRQGLALGLGQAMGSLARVLGPLIALGLFGNVAEAAPFWLGALLAAVALALVTLLPAPAGGEAPGEEIRVRT